MGITVAQLKRQVLQAQKNIEPETARIILRFEQQILDLIRENQIFDEGVDGNNKVIGVYRTTTNGNSRGFPKLRGTQVNLYDTGAFFKSFQTDYGSFQLEVFATDEKTSKIINKYNDNIFMLTEKNQDILSEKIIRPNLLKYLKTIFK